MHSFLGAHVTISLQSAVLEYVCILQAKHSTGWPKFFALDAILLLELTGNTIKKRGDSISILDDLKSVAEHSKDNFWPHNFHVYKMLISFWKENFMVAEEHCQLALACPANNIWASIYQTFFGGLVALRLHRQMGDNNDQRLKHGRDAVKRFEKWSKMSLVLFNNKLLLLQAEYSASIGEHDRAQLLYLASINAAKDHGNIHELALAYELLGNHHCSTIGVGADSNKCFRKAIVYYEQWGATAVAEKLMHKHNLKMDDRTAANIQAPQKGRSTSSGYEV